MPTGLRQSSILPFMHGPIALAITLGTQLTGWSAAESVCPAPVATCAFPAATRHSETVTTYFHTGSVVTLTAHTESECADPIATCIRPMSSVAASPESRLYWRTEHQPTVAELLQSWSAASNTHAAWTTTEKNWLARRHQPWLSAVTLDAVVRLASSVEESTLARDFTWTIEGNSDEATILRAVPTDETQRLFCPQLRVELNPMTHALTAIDVADRTGTWRPIDLPWAVLPKPTQKAEFFVLTADKIEIELTGGIVIPEISELPPSPMSAPVLRFAADRIEIDTRR